MSTMNERERSSTRAAAQNPVCADAPLTRPEFLRLPRAGSKCPITGLSRTGIFLLIKAGVVKSVVLLRPGARRGTRLVNHNSLVGYLRRLEAEQNPPAVKGERVFKEGK